jgi:hypothetical protein
VSEFKHIEQDILPHPRPSILAGFLREAKEAHSKFEAKGHGSDHNWENWYALYLSYRMDGIDAEVAAGWSNLDILAGPAVR